MEPGFYAQSLAHRKLSYLITDLELPAMEGYSTSGAGNRRMGNKASRKARVVSPIVMTESPRRRASLSKLRFGTVRARASARSESRASI